MLYMNIGLTDVEKKHEAVLQMSPRCHHFSTLTSKEQQPPIPYTRLEYIEIHNLEKEAVADTIVTSLPDYIDNAGREVSWCQPSR